LKHEVSIRKFVNAIHFGLKSLSIFTFVLGYAALAARFPWTLFNSDVFE